MRRTVFAAAAALMLSACGSADTEDRATVDGSGHGNGRPQGVGAQEPLRRSPAEVFAAEIGDRVHFDYDRYALDAPARAILARQAAWLAANPAVTVVVEGHADERGTREYNLALGDRRANAVRDYLVATGVAPDRITTVSYGKERPEAVGSDESSWSRNRRAVTVPQGQWMQ